MPAAKKLSNGRFADTWDPKLGAEICARIANGEFLSHICRDPGMPLEQTVRAWVLHNRGKEDGEGFAVSYARAREMGYDHMAEEILDIADGNIHHRGIPDNALVQQARLRSDNRKWLLARVLPKKYGDKVTQEITGDAEKPIITRIELVPVDPIVRAVTAQTKTSPLIDNDDDFPF